MPVDRAAELNFLKCGECGHTNASAVRECENCGERLYKRCRRCASKNLPGEKFCHACGRPMKKSLLKQVFPKSLTRKIPVLPIVMFLIFVPLGFKLIMFIVGSIDGTPAE